MSIAAHHPREVCPIKQLASKRGCRSKLEAQLMSQQNNKNGNAVIIFTVLNNHQRELTFTFIYWLWSNLVKVQGSGSFLLNQSCQFSVNWIGWSKSEFCGFWGKVDWCRVVFTKGVIIMSSFGPTYLSFYGLMYHAKAFSSFRRFAYLPCGNSGNLTQCLSPACPLLDLIVDLPPLCRVFDLW